VRVVILHVEGVKLTNQRKGVAVVLGLGVLALGIDRFVLRGDDSGPAAALAAPAANESDTQTIAVLQPATSAATVAPQGPTLSDLLEKHRDSSHDIGDAFSVPSEWIVTAKVEKPVEQPSTTPKDVVDPLASKMKLTAVSQGRKDNAASAIINGRTLVQGEKHDLEIGGETYEVILVSTPTYDTAIVQFTDSSREVVIKRAALHSSENSARTSR
jgi:hypothetical protein